MKKSLIDDWIFPLSFIILVVTFIFAILYLGSCAPLPPMEEDLLPILFELEVQIGDADLSTLHTFHRIAEWRRDGRLTNRSTHELYQLLLEDARLGRKVVWEGE